MEPAVSAGRELAELVTSLGNRLEHELVAAEMTARNLADAAKTYAREPGIAGDPTGANRGEAIANAILALRRIEDAHDRALRVESLIAAAAREP